MRPKRIAIVGAGYMAEEHIRAFGANPETEVVGITSRTLARAEAMAATHQIPGVYHTLSELHEETKADAVVVTVSVLSMRAVALEAFQFPWLVLLEKPAGHTYDEASLIAAEGNANCFVALNRRFYDSTRELLDALEIDDDPRFVVVEDQEDVEEADDAGAPQLVRDNWMYANSIHLIDLFNVVCRGALQSVDVHQEWTPEGPAIVTASLDFSSDDRGLYIARWNRPGPWSVSVTTPQSRRVMAPLESLSEQPRGERVLRPVELDPPGDVKPGLARLSQDVVHALEGRPHDLPTLEDSLDSMDLARRIYFPED